MVCPTRVSNLARPSVVCSTRVSNLARPSVVFAIRLSKLSNRSFISPSMFISIRLDQRTVPGLAGAPPGSRRRVAEAVQDAGPFGGVGRGFDGDPIEGLGVETVQRLVERGGVSPRVGRHFVAQAQHDTSAFAGDRVQVERCRGAIVAGGGAGGGGGGLGGGGAGGGGGGARAGRSRGGG